MDTCYGQSYRCWPDMGKTKTNRKFSVVLLDIEGTTTSISFVKDILFPYARRHLAEFLREELGEDKCNDAIKTLMGSNFNIYRSRTRKGREYAIHRIASEVNRLMDADVKSPGLKALQGLIWESAYNSGAVKGHLYPDVSPTLQKWFDERKRIFIYSSGSVFAQKLLFGHSNSGDLLPLIEGHFDTGVGQKVDAASYKSILEEIGVPASEVLFLTDNPREAEASVAAGMFCLLVDRPGNAPLSSAEKSKFEVVKSLADV